MKVPNHRLKDQSTNAVNIQEDLQDKLKEQEQSTIELQQQLLSLEAEATMLRVTNHTLAADNKKLEDCFKDSKEEIMVLKVWTSTNLSTLLLNLISQAAPRKVIARVSLSKTMHGNHIIMIPAIPVKGSSYSY